MVKHALQIETPPSLVAALSVGAMVESYNGTGKWSSQTAWRMVLLISEYVET